MGRSALLFVVQRELDRLCPLARAMTFEAQSIPWDCLSLSPARLRLIALGIICSSLSS
jgi:hypothetical protein